MSNIVQRLKKLYANRSFAQKETIVPPLSECLIPGISKSGGDFKFGKLDFSIENRNLKGVLIASLLVDLTCDGVHLRIANINDGQKVIKEGE